MPGIAQPDPRVFPRADYSRKATESRWSRRDRGPHLQVTVLPRDSRQFHRAKKIRVARKLPWPQSPAL